MDELFLLSTKLQHARANEEERLALTSLEIAFELLAKNAFPGATLSLLVSVVKMNSVAGTSFPIPSLPTVAVLDSRL
jgi:hypothetical protein